MRLTYLALILAAVPCSVVAQTPTPPAQAAPAATATDKYNVEDTDVGTLLDNPATKAILVKYLPDLVSSPQIDMARSLTLKAMQGYAPDKLSDSALAKIDAELAVVPVKK